MLDLLKDAMFIVTGYALGCLTTGYYLVRYYLSSDVRDSGSKSVGATNVGRQLGRKGFLLTFAGDFAKGVTVLLLAVLGGCSSGALGLVLLAVVCGHIWPVQLGFKGGKGVSPALGGLIVYDPVLTLIMATIFLPLYLLFRDRELSGVIVFIGLPVVAMSLGRSPFAVTVCLALALVLLWAHRENLVLLWRHDGAGGR